MARRTLIAHRHADGSVTVRHAHDADAVTAWVAAGLPSAGAPRLLGRGDPAVLSAYLDPRYDRLVVVDPDGRARTVLVCSLAVAAPLAPTRADLALAVPRESPAALRQWFVGAKSLTLDTVATGERDPATARAALRAALGARAAVSDPGNGAALLRAD